MTLPVRAALAWLILFVVMFANGTVRVLVLQPRLGEDLARQVASLIGVALVLFVSWHFARSVPGATARQFLAVGLCWLLATLAFEFSFGRLVSHQSWEVLLADYNVLAGRLWSLILVAILLGPWLAGTLRARR